MTPFQSFLEVKMKGKNNNHKKYLFSRVKDHSKIEGNDRAETLIKFPLMNKII